MIAAITGIILAGKSTLAKCLISMGYKPVLEYTTRPMREGEKNHVDYNFVTDEEFDRMNANGEFAETFFVETIYGLWKYGARTEDLKDNCILVCGPTQVKQLIEKNIPMVSILLDISRDDAMQRASDRGDDLEEFERRFDKDFPDIEMISSEADLILDANNNPMVNAHIVDNMVSLERYREMKRNGMTPDKYKFWINDKSIITSQEMTESELHLYLEGSGGLKPYLRMKDNGMPQGPLNQVAWLLLNGGGCGFCKVCRKEPCNIKDGEKCTADIAQYIRDIVHSEDAAKEDKKNE